MRTGSFLSLILFLTNGKHGFVDRLTNHVSSVSHLVTSHLLVYRCTLLSVVIEFREGPVVFTTIVRSPSLSPT